MSVYIYIYIYIVYTQYNVHVSGALFAKRSFYGRDRSEGFALTGYDIPGCVDDGAWMLWENSSAAVAAAVAPPGLEKLLEFYYGIGVSGVRGSIRLVCRVPTASGIRKVVVGEIKILKNTSNKL